MKLFALIASVASLLTVSACGDDTKTTADTTTADTTVADTTVADTGTADTGTEETTVSGDTAITDTAAPDTSSSCDHNGFTAVAQDAGPLFGAFFYLAQSTLGAPVDTLNFELVEANGGATGTGEFTLSDANYADCGNCVLAYLGCDADLANCQKTFLVQSGTLTISAFGESGGKFTGTLTNAVLAEVTVDEAFTSTLVASGETWCIDSYAFDATVQ